MDDYHSHRRHRPRFSNTNSIFSRIHERFTQRSAKNASGPSGTSFGHPGAGGSHAFADPHNKIAFTYVMNQMEQSLLPNEKSLRLVDAIYRYGR